MKSRGTLGLLAALGLCFLFSVNGPVQAQDVPNTSYANLGFWECWDDGTMDPCHNSLNDVVTLAADNAWAVGNGGLIMHWNGTSWQKYPSPTLESLWGLEMISASNGWAVGGSWIATILHWNGTDWTEVALSEMAPPLRAISMLNENEGWAVGSYGTVFHWDGNNWTKEDFPSADIPLDGVDIVSASDVWVVSSYMAIYHWNGTTWSEVEQPLVSYTQFLDIDMVSATDGWIVGTYYRIFRWDGAKWQIYDQMYPSNGGISDVSMTSPTEGWAVGDFGAKFHWNGTIWEYVGGMGTGNPNYRSVSIIDNAGWVVGTGGAITQYTGTSWNFINNPLGTAFRDLGFSSPMNGWAVGNNSLRYRWNGSTWTPDWVMGNLNYASIAVIDADNAWIAAGEKMLHWNGIEWFESSTAPSLPFSLVDTDGLNVWAAGSTVLCSETCFDVSSVIYSGNGSTWSSYSLSHVYISAIEMVSPTMGWAGGDLWDINSALPTLFVWNGITWSPVEGFTGIIMDIVAANEENVWAVGYDNNLNGQAFHWDGNGWSDILLPPGVFAGSINISPEGEVWAGGSGEFLHWNGIDWDQVLNPIDSGIFDIEMFSERSGWATGGNGVILEYEVPSVTINYSAGSPGSYFNLTGAEFPRNQTATISINGHELGTIQVGEDGSFIFTLSTSGASEGIYYVTVSVNPSVMIKLTLDEEDPLRTKEGTFTTFEVPAGIGFTSEVFLPLVKR